MTAEEIVAINARMGGSTTLTGLPSSALAQAANQSGFWNKAAAMVREIAGRHMFNDGNKRTAMEVLRQLMERNGIRSGVCERDMWSVVERVAKGEMRDIGEIAKALSGL